jgi:2-amino-4-hydroxy-6-hydroxymethyldihydropteridine diphosphokinase
MPEVFVGAGSNADPVRALRTAVSQLEQRLGAVRCSSVYRSAAVGGPAADYLNMAVALETDRTVDAVRAELKAIEALAGRSRGDPGVVALDLDLLLYGSRVDALGRLPRPGLLTTPFALVPLAELAPELADPLTGQRYGAAWRRLDVAALERLGALDALK